MKNLFLPNIYMKCHSEAIIIEKALFYTKKSQYFHLKFGCNKCPFLMNRTPLGHL